MSLNYKHRELLYKEEIHISPRTTNRITRLTMNNGMYRTIFSDRDVQLPQAGTDSSTQPSPIFVNQLNKKPFMVGMEMLHIITHYRTNNQAC